MGLTLNIYFFLKIVSYETLNDDPQQRSSRHGQPTTTSANTLGPSRSLGNCSLPHRHNSQFGPIREPVLILQNLRRYHNLLELLKGGLTFERHLHKRVIIEAFGIAPYNDGGMVWV